MAGIYETNGPVPVVTAGAFVRSDTLLIGDVVIGKGFYSGGAPAPMIREVEDPGMQPLYKVKNQSKS